MYSTMRFLAGLVLAGLAGCVSIDAQNIKNFGDAAKAVAVATQDTRRIDNQLVYEIATEQQAAQFVRGGGPYEFPPQVKPTKATGAVWNARIVYARALADYGDALAAAASGVQGNDIDTAVDNLRKATTTAFPDLSSATNFQTVSDAAGKAVKTVISQAALERIHRAIVRAHPSIVRGRDILAADLGKVADQVSRHYGDWRDAKKTALDVTGKASRGVERYQLYQNALQEDTSVRTRIALLVPSSDGQKAGYIAILDKMVTAHAALAKSTADSGSLQSFIEAAQQLRAFSEAFSREEKS